MSVPAEKPVHAASGPASSPSAAILALELLLILLVIRLFHIEEQRGLFPVTCLAAVGFLIHRRLPVTWRPAFFLAVSLASFPLVFAWPHLESGWSRAAVEGLTQTGWVLGLGLPLIALCHLPVRFGVRVALVVAAGAGLAWWRYQAAEQDDGSAAFWPVLGSIFMFRLWIYLSELRREKVPVPWPRRLSYFFLLPNAAFPFFPIIDYRRFRDGYVPGDPGPVAQRGLSWVLRGLIHLLLYRAIKLFLLPDPRDLTDIPHVALFLVANYALYLRISGYFHIITGLLHLFGFDLPRTHDRYFLAAGLSDIWRRINIYWKDFLNDHVFLPTFFALRRVPRAASVVIAVAAVFATTWLLHSWQFFWLGGEFPLAARDAALWLAAGALVAVNSLWQYRAALRGRPHEDRLTPAVAFRRSLQVAGTFLLVSFFWACWTIPTFPAVLAAAAKSELRPGDLAIPLGVLAAAVVLGSAAQLAVARLKHFGFEPRFPLERSPAACALALGLLALIGFPQVYGSLGWDASRAVAALTADAPALAEAGGDVQGYYEELADANLQSGPLIGGAARPRRHGELSYFDATRQTGDVMETELIPGWHGKADGFDLRVNRWGMRDDEVPHRKPPGTYRVALLGSSVTMGYGVPEDRDFESLLERRVNAELPQGPRVEFLNFAAGQYDALHQAALLRKKAFPFEPDAVYYVAHQGELYSPSRHLTRAYKSGFPLPYTCLGEIIRGAGVTPDMSWGTTDFKLEPQARPIVACVYRGIVEDCRRRGVLPVWVYLPMPGISVISVDTQEMLGLAREAGFVVVDLSDWADGRRPGEVKFSEADYHANADGHQLIADRLFAALQARPDALPPLEGKAGPR